MSNNEVRYDLQTALSPLFQPVNDALNADRPKRLVHRETKNGWIEFKCFEELSVFDESVALVILRIASEKDRGSYLSDSPITELGKEMRRLMDPKNCAIGKAMGLVKETSLYEIAQLLGYKKPARNEYQCIRKSLERMSSITISQRNNDIGCETHGEIGFIQHKILDDGRLSIAITYRLAMAVFGESGWMYALLNLDERNHLRGDIAKTAHKFLVSWLWRSGNRPIKLDTLASHVWAQWDVYSMNAKSTMRERLKEGLRKINNLSSWKIAIVGRGSKAMVTVTRNDMTLTPDMERESS